jgi:NAD+ synthetase
MKIGMAQIDPTVGDFEGNSEKICRFAERARKEACDLVVFPEMAVTGYPPRDLLEKSGFVARSRRYWDRLARASEGMGLICGAVTENRDGPGKPLYNAALFFVDGRLIAEARKRLLPSYDVFDEERYFEPGREPCWVDFRGKRLGITVCEDIWTEEPFLPRALYRVNPVMDLAAASIDLLVNVSASPFHVGKAEWVGGLLRSHASRIGVPVVYVNQVGGNDELIFQGRSVVWDPGGRRLACGADFREDFLTWDSETGNGDDHGGSLDGPGEVIEALALGLRDYAAKCGFSRAVLGLSGGIDSAVTACLAKLALGAENVLGVGMPGPYNAPESLEDAGEVARRLGMDFRVVPIHRPFEAFAEILAPVFQGTAPDVTEENLQARLRGVILMALSNKFNRLLLNTGNKSELAVGYCTLYGDMNGGLSVLGDVPKTMVYRVAERINRRYGWIPDRTVLRPPSAELRPGQKDEDSLPPYHVLDPILAAYVEERLSAEEIASRGWDLETVRWVVQRVDGNEYKRWQAPPVLRVTSKAFGIGRRLPIAHGYREGRTA